MKRIKIVNKIFIPLLVFAFIVLFIFNPLKYNARAQDSEIYSEQFQLEQGTARFYLTNLNENQSWVLNCTSIYKGIFYLFIFDGRPRTDYINDKKELDPKIYEDAVAYNNTPGKVFSESLNDTVSYVSLNFTAPHEKMYYMEIVLVENGPDSYRLKSSNALQVYFIPYIDGYPFETVLIISSLIIFLSYSKINKKMQC